MLSCLIVLCEEFRVCATPGLVSIQLLLNYTRWRRIWMGPVNGPSMVRFTLLGSCALSEDRTKGDQRSAQRSLRRGGAPPSFRPPLLEAVRGFGTVFGAPAEKLTDRLRWASPFRHGTRRMGKRERGSREQEGTKHDQASQTANPVAMHPRATMPRSTATTRPLAIYNPPAA